MLALTCPIPLFPFFLGDRELSHLTPKGVVTFCRCLWSRINLFPPVFGQRIWLQPPEGGILCSLGQGTAPAVKMQPGIHQEQALTDLGVFGSNLSPPFSGVSQPSLPENLISVLAKSRKITHS